MNFWQEIKQKKKNEPILVLAPMADVTDRAFRALIAKYGKPDVIWTEFVSADGLFLGGKDALINDLAFSEIERPIVAQFFTNKPEMMRKAAELAVDLGFDGVDINMGCPDKSVEKQGAGAALIKNPKLAQEIILAAKAGAKKDGKNLPVSVKTRIGYNKNELEAWLPALLETSPDVVTIHCRTRKEMSDAPARWEHIRRAVERIV
jgi:tRNA-dihydrouridine synthase